MEITKTIQTMKGRAISVKKRPCQATAGCRPNGFLCFFGAGERDEGEMPGPKVGKGFA